MKPTRIAFVRQQYTAYGGAERFVERLLDALAGQGELTLITRRWRGEPQAGVAIHRCNPRYLGRLSRDRGFCRAVRQHLAEQDYDLVQSHERIPGCDIYRAGDGVHYHWLRQRARVQGRLGRLAQWLSPWHRYTLRAERALFEDPGLRAVICNSTMVRDEIRARFAIAADKLRLIYNGIDTEAFHPRLRDRHCADVRRQYGIPPQAFLWLFVGSGFQRKGLRTVLEALARRPEAWLAVVGKDKALRRYRKLAQQRGIAERVLFLGPQRDVRPFYGAADGLALPALYEPFSNVVLEALASGLPVITSDSNGAAEIIDTGRNGAVCDALDSAGVAEAMALLEQPERRQTLRQAARQTAKPYTVQATGAAISRLYAELLETARPSARQDPDNDRAVH